jgi:tetratricopeptide (TPR) repeat protein
MAGNQTIFQEAMRKGHNFAWDKKWPQAIAEYRRAVAEIDNDPAAWISLGGALVEGKRLPEAKEAFRRASDLSPNDISLQQRLAEIYERLKDAENAMQTYLFIATAQTKAGDLPKAADAWRAIVRLNPSHAESRRNLAELLEKAKQPSEASKEYMALAHILKNLGRADEATAHARKALGLDARNADARAYLEGLQVVARPPTGPLAPIAPVTLAKPATIEDMGPVSHATQWALGRLAESAFDNPPQVAALISQAVSLHTQHRAGEALECYRRALQGGATQPELHFTLGVLLQELVRYDEAIGELQKALQQPNLMLACHFAIAQCYLSRGDGDKALEHLIETTKILDLRIAERNRLRELNALYQNLLQGYPTGLRLNVASAFMQTLSLFLSGKGWENKVADLRRRMNNVLSNGAALPLIELLLATDTPEQMLDSLAASNELAKRQKFVAAVEECYQAVSLAPSYVPLHVRLAEIFTLQDRIEAAIEKYYAILAVQKVRNDRWQIVQTYRQLLTISPQDIEARNALIQLLTQHNDLPALIDQYVELGHTYLELVQLDKALGAFQEALRLVPRAGAPDRWSPDILHRMGEIHMQRAAWQEATPIYQQIRALDPGDEKACLRLIDLCFKQERDDEAHAELAHLARQITDPQHLVSVLIDLAGLRPKDAALKNLLVDTFLQMGQMEHAIAELDSLGEMQLSAGQIQEAAQTVERIISLNPKNLDSYRELLAQLQAEA